MDVDLLLARHPRVFHVAAEESWPSIQRHGLLSTAALLDLHGVDPATRERLMLHRRMTSTTLTTPGVGTAVIRDQLPLKYIEERITPGTRLEDFLHELSSRVFLAATRERLERLLGARAYRGVPQVVLTLDTARLVERHGPRIGLSRLNSGACTQKNHPARDASLWQPIAAYPYEHHRRRYGTPLVEVTVPDRLPDALELAVEVEHLTPPAG